MQQFLEVAGMLGIYFHNLTAVFVSRIFSLDLMIVVQKWPLSQTRQINDQYIHVRIL